MTCADALADADLAGRIDSPASVWCAACGDVELDSWAAVGSRCAACVREDTKKASASPLAQPDPAAQEAATP